MNYNNVGTVEFLVNPEQDRIYFIEVNPRIQVEHTVTEMITGVDLIKTQLYIANGRRLTDAEIGLGPDITPLKMGYAIQCRITTEDPEQDFKPDYGTITAYRSAGGFGMISNCVSVRQPCRMAVPTQSVPVSPPPMTTTSRSLAWMGAVFAPLPSTAWVAVVR